MEPNTETNNQTNTEPSWPPTDTGITSTTHPFPFQCERCLRDFKSERALRMHKIRMHSGRGWDTSQNFRSKKTVNQRLAHRREYQRKLRARYRMEGKNSRGYARTGARWSDQQRAKYQRTMSTRRKAKNRTMYVYPLPAEQNTQTLDKVESIKHCPYCGHNLEKHL
jgi:hypothetical protein